MKSFHFILIISFLLTACVGADTTPTPPLSTPTSTLSQYGAVIATSQAQQTMQAATAAVASPTIAPTPMGGGNELPRVAIFTQDFEPDDISAGYIRIGTIDVKNKKIVFSETKLRVGTKPSKLSSVNWGDDPNRIRWSSNGEYLSYGWLEDKKAIIYVYDFKNEKPKWGLEFELPKSISIMLDWSADSNWLYIEIGTNAYYVLNIANGTVNNFINNKRIQGVAWHQTEPLLFFESFGGLVNYQYDPILNQVEEIELIKFAPTKFEGISSWSGYGSFDADNDGYLFSARYEDDSEAFFLQTENAPIFELLRIENNISFEQLDVIGIIPSPDKSRYLIWGQTSSFLKENYESFISTFVMEATYPMVIENVDSPNGVYPLSWSPDGKSYIGYQYAIEKNVPINADYIENIAVIDAETNFVIKDYEIGRFKTGTLYGYIFRTWLGDSSGPRGIDIYWQ